MAALACIAMLIAPNVWFVYNLGLVCVLLCASAYLHSRSVFNIKQLEQLATENHVAENWQHARSQLRLPNMCPKLESSAYCAHCLSIGYKAIIIDCVLCLSSVITLFIAI